MQLKENPGEGEQSLRTVVKRLPKGSRAQFGLRDFPLKADKEISIRFLAKSPDYTPVTLTVVQKKPPYRSYFTQRIQPSAEWSVLSHCLAKLALWLRTRRSKLTASWEICSQQVATPSARCITCNPPSLPRG